MNGLNIMEKVFVQMDQSVKKNNTRLEKKDI